MIKLKSEENSMTTSRFFAVCFYCLFSCIASVPGHAQVASHKAEAEQSQASYEAAFKGISSSPSYVLITVVDDNTKEIRRTCTNANLLLGAIDREYGFSEQGSSGVFKANEIAWKNEKHVFHFRNQAALNNIPVRYSESELSAARTLLAPFSVDELVSKFSSLYSDRRLDTRGYSNDAIACVLIERGLSPKAADISWQVYVERR